MKGARSIERWISSSLYSLISTNTDLERASNQKKKIQNNMTMATKVLSSQFSSQRLLATATLFVLSLSNLVSHIDAEIKTVDTYIAESSPTASYGTRTIARVDKRDETNGKVYGLLKFENLKQEIPDGEVLSSATLKLYTKDRTFATISAFTMKTPWSEASTWVLVNPTDGVTHDETTASFTLTPTKKRAWVSVDVTSDVQAWVEGSANNQGWILMNGGANSWSFATRNGIPNTQPVLELVTVPMPTASPTTTPTMSPTTSPSASPTTATPTASPTASPAPSTSTAPTEPAPHCCSWNYRDCGTDAWCNASSDNCEGGCNGYYLNTRANADDPFCTER
uniref:Carbohydrate-binding module family 96 domain-containing protein n=1 Tax=Entomoneis paludosa TaxID=265537 RepID=A0A7S2Y2W5_9STRA|mmetsp:Transcript_12140/g.25110  ORF Transcript_12140/g.25110 Transcript_12140/m.25110 type:complete len:338 (+) Transcript_12140:683-1696(+)